MVVFYACDGCKVRCPVDQLYRPSERPAGGFGLWCAPCARDLAHITGRTFILATVLKATAA